MKDFLSVLRAVGISSHRSLRLSLRALALVVGLVAGYVMGVLVEMQFFAWGVAALIVVVGAGLLEFVLADMVADQSFPYDTERKISLIEKRLGVEAIETITRRMRDSIREFRGCDPSCVSGTVHILAELNSTNDSRTRYGLLQLTDYVGPQGGKKGRVTLINQGIIGRCARTEELEFVDFADASEYQSAMVRDFGFTKLEAARHTATARSYLAYPLKSGDKLIGVIYFFTTEPQVFPRAANGVALDRLAQEFVNYLRLVQLA